MLDRHMLRIILLLQQMVQNQVEGAIDSWQGQQYHDAYRLLGQRNWLSRCDYLAILALHLVFHAAIDLGELYVVCAPQRMDTLSWHQRLFSNLAEHFPIRYGVQYGRLFYLLVHNRGLLVLQKYPTILLQYAHSLDHGQLPRHHAPCL